MHSGVHAVAPARAPAESSIWLATRLELARGALPCPVNPTQLWYAWSAIRASVIMCQALRRSQRTG
eukprot:362719-Chlamydomonas_euryale.AAC.1